MALWDLVQEGRYVEALAHVQEQVWVDYSSAVPILRELLCNADNPDPTAIALAAAISRARPNLTVAGETPLHACLAIPHRKRNPTRHLYEYEAVPRSTEMALALILANPDSVLSRHWDGMTPFHMACEGNDNEAWSLLMRAMLDVKPEAATFPRNNGHTPVQILWERQRSITERLALVLVTAHEGKVIQPLPMDVLLHAACSQRCPLECFLPILEQFPHQAFHQDARGNLPLHYAVRNPWFLFQMERRRCNDGTYPVPWNKMALCKLALANPEAMHVVDGVDGLLPFVTLAMKATESNAYLSLSYELLLASPDVVSKLASKTKQNAVLLRN